MKLAKDHGRWWLRLLPGGRALLEELEETRAWERKWRAEAKKLDRELNLCRKEIADLRRDLRKDQSV